MQWDVQEGDWVGVVMNADASRGVAAEINVGAKSDLVLWAALAALGLALLFGGGAALLLTLGLRGAHPASAAAPPPAPGEYPVQLEGELEPASVAGSGSSSGCC